MAAAGCHTPDCFYTGGPLNSNAAKGVCTGTSGYIANAEIYDIIKDPSRVNKHYVDAKSNTNILVYDNNQWVGYMSPEIRNSRTNLYKSLNMGGIINWAIDLETYHDPPSHLKDWDDFLQRLRSGDDPYRIGDRTGNWTELDCNDPAIRLAMEFTPAERWARLDCDHAWQDAVDVWNTHDKHKGDKSDKRRFIRSIVNTLQGPEDADCNDVFGTNCGASWPCGSFTGPSTGPAASLIWISLTNVWEVCSSSNIDSLLPSKRLIIYQYRSITILSRR